MCEVENSIYLYHHKGQSEAFQYELTFNSQGKDEARKFSEDQKASLRRNMNNSFCIHA